MLLPGFLAYLTGNGLKDPDAVISGSVVESVQLPNDEKAVAEYSRGVVKQ